LYSYYTTAHQTAESPCTLKSWNKNHFIYTITLRIFTRDVYAALCMLWLPSARSAMHKRQALHYSGRSCSKTQERNESNLTLSQTFSPTLFLQTVAKMSPPKRSTPYWSNPPILIVFDIRALWRSGPSARVPECQKTNKDGLDLYGP